MGLTYRLIKVTIRIKIKLYRLIITIIQLTLCSILNFLCAAHNFLFIPFLDVFKRKGNIINGFLCLSLFIAK